MKTVGENAFIDTIYIKLFQFLKKNKKIKNTVITDNKKKQAMILISCMKALYDFKTIALKP